jgi:antitoxin ParD1/3/4
VRLLRDKQFIGTKPNPKPDDLWDIFIPATVLAKIAIIARLMASRENAMATMNVSIPDPMKTWVEERTRDGSFSNTSDYVRHLIRRDQERAQAVAQLQAAITEGLESGDPRAFDAASLKARMRGAHGG